jgi:Ca2+-binding RTX toxin-like protein
MGTRRLLGLVGIVGALVAPSTASAKTFCVADPACPAGGEAKGSLYQALEAANGDAAPDVVRLGPGDFPAVGVEHLTALKPVQIVGAGRELTRITSEQTSVLSLSDPASSVADVTVQITELGQVGLRLNGASAARLGVSAPHQFNSVTGIVIEGPGSLVREAVVDLGPALTLTGIVSSDESQIVASTITAGIGLAAFDTGAGATVARRLRVHSGFGLEAFGGALHAFDTLVTPHPEGGDLFQGVRVSSKSAPAPITDGILVANGLTIVGNGHSSSSGVVVDSHDGTANGTLVNSIVHNVYTALQRQSADPGETAQLSVFNSSYDGAKVINFGGGTGTISQGAGNLTTALDPLFLAPASGDYRLRHDSPLIDAGGTAAPAYPLDLLGGERLRDGNGDGDARRDIGAAEYQRLPPEPSIAVTPQTAFFDTLVSFDGSATSDPDGDPITSLSWSLGDEASATGATASRTYGSPGTRQIELSATDVTGLTGRATQGLEIGLHAGRCANRRNGGRRGDLLVGFAGGDHLRGGRGKDRLLGNDGDDCLFGGPGRDRLYGGAGADRLSGGSGANRIVGGKGNDRILARNRRRDRIDCGKGRRDVVKADRRDKTRRCERVVRR